MRHKKNIIIITMCIAVFIMGIGYALLSTQIDISGSTAVTSTWQVEFSAIRTASMKGGATNKVTPSITNTSATFEVDLVSPGDEIVYEIDITNYGDIDAQVTGATYAISGSESIYVEVEGVRKGTIINSCENLEICPTITLKLTVGYDPNVSKDPEEKTKDIEFTIDVSQYVEDSQVEDAPLIPDLVEYVTLLSQILMDNTVQSDGVIDFSKPSRYVSSYIQVLGTSTASTSFYESTTYYFATSYTFNATNGTYSLAGTKTSGTWSSMSSTYSTYPYTCQSTSSTGTCSTLYKMSSYSSTTAGYAYSYTRTANYKDNGNGLFVTSVNTEGGKPTYYFRGDVDNNYVKFGKDTSGNDILWRIVRINEDGSIRIVTQNNVGTSAFNTNYFGDNAYVGYMYGTVGSNKYALTHANTNNSTIKTYLDNWYTTNLSSYSSYLADAGFCNDRSVASSAGVWLSYDTALGYADYETCYGAYNRLVVNKTPQFACPNPKNDLFTTSTSSKGNKALDYPIGLLTIDEVAYAGGGYEKSNASMYLTNGSNYWIMSPFYFDGAFAFEWSVGLDGYVSNSVVSSDYFGVRPMANLQSGVEVISGDGTSENPYVIK